MKAQMGVDAKVVSADGDREFAAGQVISGEDAETQVGLGHAVELPEPTEEASAGDASDMAATQAAIDHAQAEGIDIATLQGSGKDGKVTKADVEAAVAAKEQAG